MSREARRHSLFEIAGVAVLVAALAVLLYRDFMREYGDPADEDHARRQVFETTYADRHWGTDGQGKGTYG